MMKKMMTNTTNTTINEERGRVTGRVLTPSNVTINKAKEFELINDFEDATGLNYEASKKLVKGLLNSDIKDVTEKFVHDLLYSSNGCLDPMTDEDKLIDFCICDGDRYYNENSVGYVKDLYFFVYYKETMTVVCHTFNIYLNSIMEYRYYNLSSSKYLRY